MDIHEHVLGEPLSEPPNPPDTPPPSGPAGDVAVDLEAALIWAREPIPTNGETWAEGWITNAARALLAETQRADEAEAELERRGPDASDLSLVRITGRDDWHDEYVEWYKPEQWMGEHRAMATFIGMKLREIEQRVAELEQENARAALSFLAREDVRDALHVLYVEGRASHYLAALRALAEKEGGK